MNHMKNFLDGMAAAVGFAAQRPYPDVSQGFRRDAEKLQGDAARTTSALNKYVGQAYVGKKHPD